MNINTFTQDMIFSPLFSADELSHAYIISGGGSADRIALANTLAAAIVCIGSDKKPCGQCSQCRKSLRGIHPDIIKIDKPRDKAYIPVDSVRNMCTDALVVPNDAEAKVYIIPDAGSLLPPAQNAMLKTLEEPPKAVAFILCAENPGQLLDTVRSRCVEINLAPPEDENSAYDSHVQAFFDALEKNDLALAEFSFSIDKLDKQQLGEFLESARHRACAMLRASETGKKCTFNSQKLIKIIDVLEKTIEYIESNISTVHVAGFLAAALSEQK